jgi:hypothetical protein
MQTFGKAMRNSLPALGLGLLGVLGTASVSFIAPAAHAQTVTAKKEFVENFKAAQTAMNSRQWSTALQKADAAWPHASGSQQKAAIEQIRVASSCDASIKNHASCISAIDKAKATGGLPGSIVKNYDLMLAGRYADSGNTAKAIAQTKSNIASYGGSATEFAYVAKGELNAKNYSEAVKYAQKAIDASGKPNKLHYNILLNSYQAQNKLDDFYRVVEKIAPIFGDDTYWRMLIERARKEKNYRGNDAQIDIYRALQGAGVKLKSEEMFEMAEAARKATVPVEAANIWDQMAKANDPQVAKNKALVDSVHKQAAADKATELAKSEASAATRASGEPYATVADGYLAAGNTAKAIELYQKSIAKGEMDAGKVDLIKLRLGVAQLKGNKKADAVKTWQSIKADNGAAWLAKSWIAISKS